MEIILRPLLALAFFAIAIVLAWLVLKLIPEGRVKQLLTRRHPVIPGSEAERRDWSPVLLLFAASIFIFALIAWLGRGVI